MTSKPGAAPQSAPSPTPSAKRAPPVKVAPVQVGDLSYRQAGGDGQGSGYVEAVNKAGDLVWRAEIYRLSIKPELERDVQEVYFTDMTFDAEARALIITTELNERFSLDIDVQKVTPLD